MSTRSWTAAAAPFVYALSVLATPALAAREIGDVASLVHPPAVDAACDGGLTVDRFNACEVGLMRWRLCERVYISQPHDDDAFFACFDGAN